MVPGHGTAFGVRCEFKRFFELVVGSHWRFSDLAFPRPPCTEGKSGESKRRDVSRAAYPRGMPVPLAEVGCRAQSVDKYLHPPARRKFFAVSVAPATRFGG
jgi:hypothetical protein